MWRCASVVAVWHDIGSELIIGSRGYGEIVDTATEGSSVNPAATTDLSGLLRIQYNINFFELRIQPKRTVAMG